MRRIWTTRFCVCVWMSMTRLGWGDGSSRKILENRRKGEIYNWLVLKRQTVLINWFNTFRCYYYYFCYFFFAIILSSLGDCLPPLSRSPSLPAIVSIPSLSQAQGSFRTTVFPFSSSFFFLLIFFLFYFLF